MAVKGSESQVRTIRRGLDQHVVYVMPGDGCVRSSTYTLQSKIGRKGRNQGSAAYKISPQPSSHEMFVVGISLI